MPHLISIKNYGSRIKIHDGFNSYETEFEIESMDEYIRLLEDINNRSYGIECEYGDVSTKYADKDYDIKYFRGNYIKLDRIEVILEKLFNLGYGIPNKEYRSIKELLKDRYKFKRFNKKSIKQRLDNSSLKSLLLMRSKVKKGR